MNSAVQVGLNPFPVAFDCLSKCPVPALLRKILQAAIPSQREAVTHAGHPLLLSVIQGKLIPGKSIQQLMPELVGHRIVQHELRPDLFRNPADEVTVIGVGQ